jgi:hypothetical protein
VHRFCVAWKSKYLELVPARRVFRYAGMDVTSYLKGKIKRRRKSCTWRRIFGPPGAGSPKRLAHALRSAEAEGVENSVKGSLKQQPKSHSGCGAYLAPAPGTQNRCWSGSTLHGHNIWGHAVAISAHFYQRKSALRCRGQDYRTVRIMGPQGLESCKEVKALKMWNSERL